MPLALEQIAQLAPDEKSLAAARQSMSLRLWSGYGLSESAIWGRCQGSTTYDVAVDLLSLGDRCNCPSRKRPCRHVLGLLMLLATQVEAIPEMQPPAHVQEWLDKRRQREFQKAHTTASPAKKSADPAGRHQRAARREDRIEQGAAQLELWLCDLVRNGLAGIQEQGSAPWEEQARRLVDAQAGGLANRIRQLGEIPASSRDWPQRLLFEMGRIELLLEAYTHLADLPENLRMEIRQLIGWTLNQQELETLGERVRDDWIVCGQRHEDDDRLRMQRTWLIGRMSQRRAFILQFAPGVQPFKDVFFPGTVLPATLLFYPGSMPLRARLLEESETLPFRGELPGQDLLDDILDLYADQLAAQPWLTGTMFILRQATISTMDDNWYLRDHTGAGVPLKSAQPWRLLAETGGRPADMVFEWCGEQARLLSLVIDQSLILVE